MYAKSKTWKLQNVFDDFNPRLSGIGDNLAELLRWRNTCDYDDVPEILINLDLIVESALDDAREIMDALNN